MTAVEKFHFGVEKYFINTFQLPTFREDMKCRKYKKKSLHWMKLLQGLSSIFCELCSFFVFVCMFVLS